jgi:hypothetical protein
MSLIRLSSFVRTFFVRLFGNLIKLQLGYDIVLIYR